MTTTTPLRPTVPRFHLCGGCGGISDTLNDIDFEDLGAPFNETPHSYQLNAPPRHRRLAGGISDTLLN